MTGHAQLCNLRLDGYVPQLVWVETDPLRIRYDALFPIDPNHMAIFIAPSANPRRLDLRCVYGLTCVVGSCDAQRVEEITAACICAGAARVIANTHIPTRCGEFKTASVTDTTGALAWPTS